MRLIAICMIAFFPSVLLAEEKTFACKDRSFKVTGEVIAFNDKTVVMKKKGGDLVAIELNELCEEDVKYFKSKEAKEQQVKDADTMHTWTGVDGLKVVGKVLEYGRKEIAVQRKLGKVMIDGREFSDLDALHQKVVLKVLSKLEGTRLTDGKELVEWAKKLGGQPKKYLLEGVLLELESGDTVGVPFFMFTAEDQEVLKPGWEAWMQQTESEEAQERESFLMRSAAMAYQRDRAANRQVELLKLNMLASVAGVTSIWQISLIPNNGHYGRPITVMATARDSNRAAAQALRSHPGYIVGAIKRVSR